MTAITQIANGDSGLTTRSKINHLITQVVDVTMAPFNATGDGSTNDTAAIQAAVDWTAAEGRGIIFFPPGTYITTAPITFNSNAPGIHFLGCGIASRIVGNFNGFIIDRGNANITGNGRTIEKLQIINGHATGGGIRLACSVGAAIRDCNIGAPQAIIMVSPVQVTQSFVIENCSLSANGQGGPTNGIEVGANGVISGCDFNGFDCAIRASRTCGLVVQGCRIEVCGYGVFCGQDYNQGGGVTGQDGFVMLGGTMESCSTALRLGGKFLVAGVVISASQGSAPGLANPQYGMLLVSNGAIDGQITGCNVSGYFDIAAISIGASSNRAGQVFSGVSAVNAKTTGGALVWELPTTAHTAEWVNCNVNPTFLFSGLPTSTSRRTGDMYYITDGNQSTLGGNVTAGGGANSGMVIWNGSNWTLMSK